MPRYRLDIEYDGSAYAGWQRQAGQHSVQAAIEQAIKGFSGEDVTHPRRRPHRCRRPRARPGRACRSRQGLAGRHGARRRQRASADGAETRQPSSRRRSCRRFRCPLLGDRPPLSLPHRQPPRAAGARSEEGLVGGQAARRRGDARGRASAGRPARLHHLPLVAMPGQEPDQDARPARCRRAIGDAIEIRASARSFLHNQVRSMVGSLKRVGEGALDHCRPRGGAAARDRAACGPVAPPDGLYLVGSTIPQRLIRCDGRSAEQHLQPVEHASESTNIAGEDRGARPPRPCRSRHWSFARSAPSTGRTAPATRSTRNRRRLGTNMRSSVGGSIIQMISAERPIAGDDIVRRSGRPAATGRRDQRQGERSARPRRRYRPWRRRSMHAKAGRRTH